MSKSSPHDKIKVHVTLCICKLDEMTNNPPFAPQKNDQDRVNLGGQ